MYFRSSATSWVYTNLRCGLEQERFVRVMVSPSAGGTFLGGQKSTQKSQPAAITAAAGIARLGYSATVHLAAGP